MAKNKKTIEEAKPEVFQEELADAVIDGAECVNIRREPEVIPNNQIAILGKGTKIVVVDPKKTEKNKDGEWYKIRIVGPDPKDPVNNGYAMKQYIKIV